MSDICTYESGLQRGTRFLEWIICLPAWSTVLELLKAMYLLIPGYSPFYISCFAFFAFLSVQCADRKKQPNIFKVIDSTGETTGACVSIIQFAKFFWYFIGQQVDRQQIFDFGLDWYIWKSTTVVDSYTISDCFGYYCLILFAWLIRWMDCHKPEEATPYFPKWWITWYWSDLCNMRVLWEAVTRRGSRNGTFPTRQVGFKFVDWRL